MWLPVTCDLLVYLTHRWAAAIGNKRVGLAVSLDMTKTFDQVWHRAPLTKLLLRTHALNDTLEDSSIRCCEMI